MTIYYACVEIYWAHLVFQVSGRVPIEEQPGMEDIMPVACQGGKPQPEGLGGLGVGGWRNLESEEGIQVSQVPEHLQHPLQTLRGRGDHWGQLSQYWLFWGCN